MGALLFPTLTAPWALGLSRRRVGVWQQASGQRPGGASSRPLFLQTPGPRGAALYLLLASGDTGGHRGCCHCCSQLLTLQGPGEDPMRPQGPPGVGIGATCSRGPNFCLNPVSGDTLPTHLPVPKTRGWVPRFWGHWGSQARKRVTPDSCSSQGSTPFWSQAAGGREGCRKTELWAGGGGQEVVEHRVAFLPGLETGPVPHPSQKASARVS